MITLHKATDGWMAWVPPEHDHERPRHWHHLTDSWWAMPAADVAQWHQGAPLPWTLHCANDHAAWEARPLPEEPWALGYTLLDHQPAAVRWAWEHPFAYIADDPGLGKTVESIATVQMRREAGDTGPILVITGRSAVESWMREIRTFDPGHSVSEYTHQSGYTPPTEWVVTTYEQLRSDYEPPSRGRRGRVKPGTGLAFAGWHTVIADEVHKVKNPYAQRTRAFLNLHPKYGIMLSGTPIVNAYMDAWTPLSWGGIIHYTPRDFGKRFGEYNPFRKDWNAHPEKMGELKQYLELIMIRRLKTEVTNLPEKITTVVPVRLRGAQRRAYAQARDEWLVEIDQHPEVIQNPLTQLLRLKQICGGLPLLDPEATAHAKWDLFVDQWADLLDTGGKVFVWTQFRDQWAWVMEHGARWNPVGIRGDTSSKMRGEVIQRFQQDPDCRLFVATAAAQESITLTAAQTAVLFDLPWSPAYITQITDRIHRVTQTGTVNVYYLVAQDTIEERTLNVNLHNKAELQRLLLEARAFV